MFHFDLPTPALVNYQKSNNLWYNICYKKTIRFLPKKLNFNILIENNTRMFKYTTKYC